MLLLLLIIYSVITVNMAANIIRHTSSTHHIAHSFNILSIQSNIDKSDNINAMEQPSKVSSIIEVIIYFFLLIFCIIMLILYIVTESLPKHNILGIESFVQNLISHSISPIIAINTSLIIPRFTTSICDFFNCLKLWN
eukprot:8165_1